MVEATAPGKVILFGEHAVVYGRPAIAVPVSQVRARATVTPYLGTGIRLVAADLAIDKMLADSSTEDPLAAAVLQVKRATGIAQLPNMTISVTSELPIASGLGSGAAITAAIVRAVTQYVGLRRLATREWVSNLTYEVEKIHHGTPSGIDNTVVTYEQPVYFRRDQPKHLIEIFSVPEPLLFLVVDSGIRSSTKAVVNDVRSDWEANPVKLNALFDQCGRIVDEARTALELGKRKTIGRLMTENHAALQEMNVSSPTLDRLVQTAMESGASGAKLSGAGRGGNIIALVREENALEIADALNQNGARNVLRTVVE
jgi:mevalonate kinase